MADGSHKEADHSLTGTAGSFSCDLRFDVGHPDRSRELLEYFRANFEQKRLFERAAQAMPLVGAGVAAGGISLAVYSASFGYSAMIPLSWCVGVSTVGLSMALTAYKAEALALTRKKEAVLRVNRALDRLWEMEPERLDDQINDLRGKSQRYWTITRKVYGSGKAVFNIAAPLLMITGSLVVTDYGKNPCLLSLFACLAGGVTMLTTKVTEDLWVGALDRYCSLIISRRPASRTLLFGSRHETNN